MKKLSEHDLALRDQMRDIVSFVLTSTKHHKDDPQKREQVANSMIRAMGMSNRRGGCIDSPQDTEIYRIAEVIKESTNWKEFLELCKAVSRKNPVDILTSYNLEWSPKFQLPEHIKAKLVPDKTHVMHNFSPPVKEVTNEELITKTIETLTSTISELKGEVDFLKNIIRNHIHIDNKVKVVSYQEF